VDGCPASIKAKGNPLTYNGGPEVRRGMQKGGAKRADEKPSPRYCVRVSSRLESTGPKDARSSHRGVRGENTR